MRAVLRRVVLAVTAAVSAADEQAPTSPREEALRAAVKQFYDALVEEKYRKAFALVAEDSQDHFLKMGKPEIETFRIQKVEFNENGTQAEVTVEADMQLRFLGQSVPVKRPLNSTWKLVEGEWLWYYVPPAYVETPFGRVTLDPEARRRKVDLKEEMERAVKPAELTTGLLATPERISFPARQAAEREIELKNGLPGWINLSVMVPKVAGLATAAFEPALGPQQTRVIRLVWTPIETPPAEPIELVVQASPIGGAKVIELRWEP